MIMQKELRCTLELSVEVKFEFEPGSEDMRMSDPDDAAQPGSSPDVTKMYAVAARDALGRLVDIRGLLNGSQIDELRYQLLDELEHHDGF